MQSPIYLSIVPFSLIITFVSGVKNLFIKADRPCGSALKDSEIKAPYHGVVINRHTVVGNYARVGDPIISLLNDEDLEIEADVPSIRAIDLNPGTLVTGLLQHGRTIQAKVRVVVPQENVKRIRRHIVVGCHNLNGTYYFK